MAVVLSDDRAESVRGLYEWMKAHLAEHKLPSRWWAVGEIPRTSRGKINRDAVKDACAKQPCLDLAAILAKEPR
jgi:acyl-coenzyme A synthetase/AMP-(fatty) acid ligase